MFAAKSGGTLLTSPLPSLATARREPAGSLFHGTDARGLKITEPLLVPRRSRLEANGPSRRRGLRRYRRGRILGLGREQPEDFERGHSFNYAVRPTPPSSKAPPACTGGEHAEIIDGKGHLVAHQGSARSVVSINQKIDDSADKNHRGNGHNSSISSPQNQR